MNMQCALTNAIGRIDMSVEADDEHDHESSNQHLRMAIQNVGDMLEQLLVPNKPCECSQIVVTGIRAIWMLGAAACEHSNEARSRFRGFARENIRQLAEAANLPRSSRVRQALSA